MKFIKNNLRLIIAVIIAIILIVTGVIFINNDKKVEGDKPIEEIKSKEEQLMDATGMSKDKAIELVKENFGSDNYKFSASATDDGLYKVIVTNVVDNSEIIYFVDPTNGMTYVDMETK